MWASSPIRYTVGGRPEPALMTSVRLSSVTQSGKPAPSDAAEIPSQSPSLGPVPLILENPCGSSSPQPVTVGIPFPPGALRNPDRLRLVDAAGRLVCVQMLPLAHWP